MSCICIGIAFQQNTYIFWFILFVYNPQHTTKMQKMKTYLAVVADSAPNTMAAQTAQRPVHSFDL